ncbi:MAG: hypothetical protein NTV49_12235, partial [Kiritimatiellaeota bacterium]|nr:hypothetical protein [Kiritimatiellota bacterium]
LVLTAIVTRPKHIELRNPECLPGAIVGLLGAIILDLFMLATVFGNLYYREGTATREREARCSMEQRMKPAEQGAAPAAAVAPSGER